MYLTYNNSCALTTKLGHVSTIYPVTIADVIQLS